MVTLVKQTRAVYGLYLSILWTKSKFCVYGIKLDDKELPLDFLYYFKTCSSKYFRTVPTRVHVLSGYRLQGKNSFGSLIIGKIETLVN